MADTAAGGASFTRRCVLQLTGAAAALPAAPLQSNSLENSRMSFTPKFVDLVRNTTTTVGTNDFTLGAAMTGFTSFTAACQVGDNFYYSAIGIDKPAEREVGRGTLLAGGVIGRDPIGGIKTNFSNGTKAVALITAAEWYSDMQSGAASGPPMTATRPELAGAVPQRVAVLSEPGREGVFLFKSGDYSASVAADAAQGIYIAPVNDPSGKSGAWVRHYDGSVNVRWFGAKGDGSSDDSSAFISAIAFVKSIACNASAIYKGSPRLFIPAGEYFLGTTTLDITHTLIIEGEGGIAFGAGAGSPTKLRWADGTTGIRIQAYDTSAASIVDGPHFAGAWTQIRNIYLYGGYAGTESEAHGIHTKCTVILENVMVENFPGDALYAHTSSGSGSPNEGNSNTSRVTNCHFRNSRNGVSILGADANAWLFLGCWFTSNRAWGVDDRSFLGNSYFGCHNDGNGITADSATLGASVVSYSGNRYAVKVGQEVAAAANPPSGTAADNSWWYYMAAGDPSGTGIPAWTSGMKVRSGGAYNTDNGTGSGSASNVFAGNYSESGQGPSQFAYPTMVYGGSMASGVRGYATYSYNYQGWWRTGSVTSGRGAMIDGSSTVYGDFTVDGGRGSGALNIQGNGSAPIINLKEGGITYGYFLCVGSVAYLNGSNSLILRQGGSDVATIQSSGMNIASGKALLVNGTQVVGPRQTGTAADASDLATAIALVNDLKAKLIAHGLIS